MKNPTLDDGWLYCFQDGYLWRELRCLDGLLYEVNLETHAELDERQAQGLATSSLVLVTRVNGRHAKNHLFFSSVQLSWPRLQRYGGMAATDPRNVLHQNQSSISEPTINKELIERAVEYTADDLLVDPQTKIPLFSMPSLDTLVKRCMQDLLTKPD